VADGASWAALRTRWELGHLVGFVLSLTGFVALAIAMVREIPERAPASRERSASPVVPHPT